MRITNTEPFTAYSTANLSFAFKTVTYNTSIVQYINKIPTLLITNETNCFSNAENIILNAPLAAFTVTGGGLFCEGTTGLPVGVDNSQGGVIYTLYRDGVALTPSVAGTGKAISFRNQSAAGTFTVKGASFRGSIDMTGSVINTVDPLPATSLIGITGSNSYNPGIASVATYSIPNIADATSYVWSYSGTGVIINGTGSNVTLDFSATATNGQLSVKGHNDCGDGVETLLTIMGTKMMNLTSVLLEGLYMQSNPMRPASDANGQPHWSAGIADHITIELHSAADYGTIAFTAKEVPLTIGGTVNVRVPGYLNESYYITIRHHNSLMIVSATAVSFENANINKSFSTPADVYGGKLKQMTDNRYAIFTGDVNQDNIIDLSDVSSIYNVYSIGGFSGYIPEDVSGDGEITKTDTEFIELGSSKAIKSATP